jgi:hypothetical protein
LLAVSNRPSFGALPPHFNKTDDHVAREGVQLMFPSLAAESIMLPIFKLSLASLVFYSEYLMTTVPGTHSLNATSLFRLGGLRQLLRAQLVQCDSLWMRATGIPPQAIIFGLQERIQATVCALPDLLAIRLVMLLEQKCICGVGITQHQLETTSRRVVEERSISCDISTTRSQAGDGTLHVWPSNGKFHALPESFHFPSTDVLHALYLWWFGNPSVGLPLLKIMSTRDLSTR